MQQTLGLPDQKAHSGSGPQRPSSVVAEVGCWPLQGVDHTGCPVAGFIAAGGDVSGGCQAGRVSGKGTVKPRGKFEAQERRARASKG